LIGRVIHGGRDYSTCGADGGGGGSKRREVVPAATASKWHGGGGSYQERGRVQDLDQIEPKDLIIALLCFQGVICKITHLVSGRLDQYNTKTVIRHSNECFATSGTAVTNLHKFRDH